MTCGFSQLYEFCFGMVNRRLASGQGPWVAPAV
jgi:hypothetical protein